MFGYILNKKAIAILFLAVTGISGMMWANGNPDIEQKNQTVTFKVVQDKNGSIEFSQKDFIIGTPKFYIYRFNDTSVRFLVMRSSDGVFRAAFDGCVICYRAKKGFHQEGDYTVCNNCGNRYPSVRINTETGSCNPIPLNRVSKNGKVIITVADLRGGIGYFQ